MKTRGSNGGRFVAVVGPSGVGKDSVIAGVLAAKDDLLAVRRTVTRAPGLGGEDYYPVSEDVFKEAVANDEFCLHWRAHGLHYGIPTSVLQGVNNGRQYIANLSRTVLVEAADRFPDFVVIQLTASAQTLAHRLAGRGRESERDIAQRLARSDYPMPEGLPVYPVSNDGVLQLAIDEITELLDRPRMQETQRPGCYSLSDSQ